MTNFEDLLSEEENSHKLMLRLFVAGGSSISVRAINNLQQILETDFAGLYELSIIDVHQQPDMIRSENITALPVLIRDTPTPKRLLVGDMSDKNRVLRGLKYQ